MARRARVMQGETSADHAAALRHHLIQVTQTLLSSQGIHGLSTRVIARTAGVSDGLLYNHFADKDELIVTALLDQLTTLVEQHLVDFPEPGKQDLHDGLTWLATRSLAFQRQALPIVGALLSRPDLVHQLLVRAHEHEPGLQQLLYRTLGFLRAEQQAGTITADADVTMVALVLFGVQHLTVLGDTLRRDGTDDPAPPGLGATEDRLVAFLMRACASTP